MSEIEGIQNAGVQSKHSNNYKPSIITSNPKNVNSSYERELSAIQDEICALRTLQLEEDAEEMQTLLKEHAILGSEMTEVNIFNQDWQQRAKADADQWDIHRQQEDALYFAVRDLVPPANPTQGMMSRQQIEFAAKKLLTSSSHTTSSNSAAFPLPSSSAMSGAPHGGTGSGVVLSFRTFPLRSDPLYMDPSPTTIPSTVILNSQQRRSNPSVGSKISKPSPNVTKDHTNWMPTRTDLIDDSGTLADTEEDYISSQPRPPAAAAHPQQPLERRLSKETAHSDGRIINNGDRSTFPEESSTPETMTDEATVVDEDLNNNLASKRSPKTSGRFSPSPAELTMRDVIFKDYFESNQFVNEQRVRDLFQLQTLSNEEKVLLKQLDHSENNFLLHTLERIRLEKFMLVKKLKLKDSKGRLIGIPSNYNLPSPLIAQPWEVSPSDAFHQSNENRRRSGTFPAATHGGKAHHGDARKHKYYHGMRAEDSSNDGSIPTSPHIVSEMLAKGLEGNLTEIALDMDTHDRISQILQRKAEGGGPSMDQEHHADGLEEKEEVGIAELTQDNPVAMTNGKSVSNRNIAQYTAGTVPNGGAGIQEMNEACIDDIHCNTPPANVGSLGAGNPITGKSGKTVKRRKELSLLFPLSPSHATHPSQGSLQSIETPSSQLMIQSPYSTASSMYLNSSQRFRRVDSSSNNNNMNGSMRKAKAPQIPTVTNHVPMTDSPAHLHTCSLRSAVFIQRPERHPAAALLQMYGLSGSTFDPNLYQSSYVATVAAAGLNLDSSVPYY